jgi:hypothetical protein
MVSPVAGEDVHDVGGDRWQGRPGVAHRLGDDAGFLFDLRRADSKRIALVVRLQPLRRGLSASEDDRGCGAIEARASGVVEFGPAFDEDDE